MNFEEEQLRQRSERFLGLKGVTVEGEHWKWEGDKDLLSYIKQMSYATRNNVFSQITFETTCGDPDCINPEHLKMVLK
jgi:hypothetical protein